MSNGARAISAFIMASSPTLIDGANRARRRPSTRLPLFSPGLGDRGRFDNAPELAAFADALEKTRVETGFMTKNFAMLIGPAQPSLTAQPFLDNPDENLQDRFGHLRNCQETSALFCGGRWGEMV